MVKAFQTARRSSVSPLLRGVGDGVAHELTGLGAGIAQLCAAQQRAEHDRGEHVARSRIIAVDALMQADGQLSVFQTARADPSRLVVQTGQHDRRAVLLIERAHPLLRLALGLRRGRRVAAEQDRRLGGIRGDEVRDRAELAHPRAHFGRYSCCTPRRCRP